MEALYSKLYDKYNTLKKKRLSELDEVNKDQEVKFLHYVSAAEELIQHLKDENCRLRAQVNDLRSEVDSIRSNKDEQLSEYQKSLMEENQKNKMLSEDVEKLQKQLQEGLACNSNDNRNKNTRLNMLEAAHVTPIAMASGPMTRTKRKHSEIAQVTTVEVSSRSTRRSTRKHRHEYRLEMEERSIRTTRKRSQESGDHMEGAITPAFSQRPGEVIVRGLPKGSSMGTHPTSDLPKDQQLECCKKIVNGADSDGVKNDGGSAVCEFQALIEYLVGMKLSSVNQTEGNCISALHQSSGYSFSLTWVKKAAGEEPELLYRVLTLGTFEMVAPEWMRSILMFSKSMCPIFFERGSSCYQAASLMVFMYSFAVLRALACLP